MDDNKTIRPRNNLYEVLVLLNGIILIGIWWIILRSLNDALLAGCVTYLILAWGLRLLFQKHHMNGMKYMKAKNYSDALVAFEKSRDFFEQHPAID